MMKSMRTNLDNHFLSFMVIACLVLAAAAAVLYYQGTAAPLVDSLLRGNRPIVYGTLASINGSLLGFSIAVTSIVLGFSSSDRLAVLRESPHYPTLWRTLSATTKVLGVATLLSLACLLFDRDQAPSKALTIALVPVILLSIAYLGRTVWILDQIVTLITMPPSGRTRLPPVPAIQKAQ
jgi:hypothetical protein